MRPELRHGGHHVHQALALENTLGVARANAIERLGLKLYRADRQTAVARIDGVVNHRLVALFQDKTLSAGRAYAQCLVNRHRGGIRKPRALDHAHNEKTLGDAFGVRIGTAGPVIVRREIGQRRIAIGEIADFVGHAAGREVEAHHGRTRRRRRKRIHRFWLSGAFYG